MTRNIADEQYRLPEHVVRSIAPLPEYQRFSLLHAVYYGHPKVAEILINSGADPTKVHEPSGSTAADVAEQQGHSELAAYLRALV